MLVAPVAGVSLVAGCSRQDAAPRRAPDFLYTLLDGSVRHSAALRGQVVLVNFWATTCAICVKEMPQLVATHQRFGPQGLHTLAVAVRYDPPALVADFALSRRLPFGVVIDNTGAIAKAFPGVQATPTTFVIDKQGAIVKRIVGAPDFLELHLLVGKLLTET